MKQPNFVKYNYNCSLLNLQLLYFINFAMFILYYIYFYLFRIHIKILLDFYYEFFIVLIVLFL